MKLVVEGLKNTSFKTILIGADTADREWVILEIVKSFDKEKGIFGIPLNRVKGRTG